MFSDVIHRKPAGYTEYGEVTALVTEEAHTVIPSSLAGIIIWNGGMPIPPLETVMLRLAKNDLDPVVRRQLQAQGSAPKLDAVQDAFFPSLFCNLPAGWTFVGVYKGVPQIHLRYSGSELTGTAFAGTEADVFLCIATSAMDQPSSQRQMYVRDLPMPGSHQSGKYAQAPYNVEAAWLTLFVWGTASLNTSWKRSSDVEGYFTFEGEVLATALM